MGHYERLLIDHLVANASELDWSFQITFGGRGNKDILQLHTDHPAEVRADLLGFSTRRLSRVPWQIARAATGFRRGSAVPALYHSLALDYPAPPGRPFVLTIHDLPPARFTDEGSLPIWASRAARSAACVITPSQFGKAEIVDILHVEPERVHVIPNGCEHHIFNVTVAPASKSWLAQRGIPGRFILYSGGATRRKNVRALLEAWRIMGPKFPDHCLALAGPQHLAAVSADADVPRTVTLGHLDRQTLASVLRASEALVCPSIYEGFGLPPLEAMASGVPVVGVQAGAVPEVVADAALLVSDGTPELLADGIQRVLCDHPLADRLRHAGPRRAASFSWEEHASHVLDVYNGVLAAC